VRIISATATNSLYPGMPLKLQRSESVYLIQMDGEITLAAAEDLKNLLIEWLGTGTDLELDLDNTDRIDIPILQLLWASAREASRSGVAIKTRMSAAAAKAARDSGFAELPA
jgi:anti-anti-sigma regulatory factor